MAKILLVEDDASLAKSVAECLETEGHRLQIVNDGGDGLSFLKASGFDLAILDWQLPGLCGPEICQKFRIAGGRIPILMLTQKSNVADREEGLDSGADDYLAKPFEVRELRARVRALLRRSTGLFDAERKSAGISLDYAACTATIGKRTTRLLHREFDLLEFLMRHPHTFFTAEKLLDFVWSSEGDVTIEAVRTCVSRLRTKLDVPDEGISVIETIKGWGYKLSDKYAGELQKSNDSPLQETEKLGADTQH